MSLINCPECRKEISSKAAICPNCGYNLKSKRKKRYFIICGIIIFIVALLIVGIIITVVKRENREKLKSELLGQAEKYYEEMDLDSVLECYDKLEELNYDTKKLRSTVEYDVQNYEAGLAYREALDIADEKLNIDTIERLSDNELFDILSELSNATDAFNGLCAKGINEDAKVGQYIYNVKNNPMFKVLWNDFLVKRATVAYNNHVENAIAIKVAIEELLEVEFPYLKE